MGWGTVRLIFGDAILPLCLSLVAVASVATPIRARAESLPLEFKILLDTQNNSADKVAKQLSFSRAAAEQSNVYFYDTKDLKLFKADLYIRSREVRGANGEIMVKARPVDKDDVDPSWFRVNGFICELDGTQLKTIPSCTIRQNRSSRELDSVVNEQSPLSRVLTNDQQDFANDFGGFKSVESRVRPLGPITAWRWRLPSASGWKVDVEYWSLPNGDTYIELSIKGMQTDQEQLSDALAKFVKARGLDTAPLTLNKTSKVLKALSSSL